MKHLLSISAHGSSLYHLRAKSQGNVRQVTDADGRVEQDNHYSPYGMLMGESSDILATAKGGSVTNPNPYLYGAKEYLTTAGANLLDFTARTYDPSLPLFQTQDPMAGDYTPFNTYLYCGGDPVNRVDRDGRDWEIETLQDENLLYVNIKITGVLLNLSSETFDMGVLHDAIKAQLEDVYTFNTDGLSVNLTADIRLVESMDDIVVSDHVFAVIDQSFLNEDVLAKTAGYGVWIGTDVAKQTISGENSRTLAHELGHTGGLYDVNLQENDLLINHPESNLMTQTGSLHNSVGVNDGILLEPVQIKRIIQNYHNKNNDKDMMPYYGLKNRAININILLNWKKSR